MTLRPAPQRSPRGTTLTCKGWQQEAALRLLRNSLDAELAERPADLLISGEEKVARDWNAFDSLVTALRELDDDRTLFVRDGAIADLYRTGSNEPRLLSIGPRASEDDLRRFRRPGNLHRFTRVCAANWFCVGNQATLQPAYEILGAAAQERFAGTLSGKLVVSCGLNAVSGAQPLAATLHGAAALGIDPDSDRVKHCVKSGYCEVMVNDLDEALRILKNSVRKHEPASVGLVADCSNAISELARRGVVPDILLANLFARAATAAETHALSELQNLGAIPLDGETFRPDGRIGEQSEPLVCIALSGNSADIAVVDRLLGDLFPSDTSLQDWIALARRHVRFQGLPSRVVWLSPAERQQFALAINESVARGEIQAPIVLGGIFHRAFGRPPEGSPARVGRLSTFSRNTPVKLPDIAPPEAGSLSFEFINTCLLMTNGLSWVALENLGGDLKSLRKFGGAIVADGTPRTAANIARILTPTNSLNRRRDVS